MGRVGWFDFIGDIHGRALSLRKLLKDLGYREKRGAFSHPRSHAVFLGDVLNRGPQIRSAIRLVRGMVDSGSATMLLGNHELLALWQARHPRQPVTSCPFAEKAARHLIATRREFAQSAGAWRDLLNWLAERPVYFLHPQVRAAHACWAPPSIVRIWDNRLRSADLASAASARFLALWTLLEGPALIDPAGRRFRIRWWEQAPTTWSDSAYPQTDAGSAARIPAGRMQKFFPYPASAPPVFFGHYGFFKRLAPVLPNAACLDLGAAKGGPLAAYRWTGERRLLQSHFHASR